MPLFQESVRRERLAVNVYDLKRLDPALFGKLSLAQVLDFSTPIWMDRNRDDEHAVAFRCTFLTAAMTCDVLRVLDRKAGRMLTRVYLFRGAWTKLSSTALLTVMVRGTVLRPGATGVERCVLNPDLLKPSPLPPAKASPLPVKRAVFGQNRDDGSTVCNGAET